MVLENLIKKLMPRRQLTADPELLSFLIQVQKEETQHTVQHLRKGDTGLKLITDNSYALYVHDAGNYQIRVINEGNIVDQKTAHFKKPGTYMLRPYLDFKAGLAKSINENHVALIGVPCIGITKFGSKNSYAHTLHLFSANLESNKDLQNLFEQAESIKKKRDALPEDKTDYWLEVFDTEHNKSKPWSRIIKYAFGLATGVIIANGTIAHYGLKERKLKQSGEQITHETKKLEGENDHARGRAIREDMYAVEAIRLKAEAAEAEKNRIFEEEQKRRNEEFYKENLAKLNEIQTEMKNNFQKTIQETYKDADITDLVWKAYCSDPVLQKGGPNWQTTTFTVQFKDYTMNASFHTAYRVYDGKNVINLTTIRTAIIKDGKAITFDEKGKADQLEAIPEEDKKYVQDFAQKHNLAEVRKNLIDAVIEKQRRHQADAYKGRD